MTLSRLPPTILPTILCLLVCSQSLMGQVITRSLATAGSDSSESEDPVIYPDDDDSRELWLGVGVGTGFLSAERGFGLQELSVTFGGYVERSNWLQFSGSYMHTPIQRTSDPEYPVKHGVSIAELGMDFKFYTPRRYSFLGHYFTVGLGASCAFWNYDQSSPAAADIGRSFDVNWGVDIHVGTGFELGRLGPLSANLDVTPGLTLWPKRTDESSPASYLHDFFYLKAGVHLSYAITSW